MTKRIAFVDRLVADVALPLRARGVAVHLLDPKEDLPAQILRSLAASEATDVIDVFCHGQPGRLALAAGYLDSAGLQEQAASWEDVGLGLPQEGGIFVYGCDVASGEAGRAFVDALASLTSRPVRAASDKVGAAGLGGQWNLDVGQEVVAMSSLSLPEYEGTLDVLSGSAGNDSIPGTVGDDTIYASLGLDTIDGGAGTDTLIADLDLSGVSTNSTFGLQYRFTDNVSFDYRAEFASLQQYIPQAASGYWMEIGNAFLLRSHNVEVIQTTLVGTPVNDLLIVQGGNKYWGGAGTDTLYADWSAATAGISWVNAPTTTQTVNGVSVSGIERLLVATGSGNDHIDNNYAGNDSADYIGTGAGNDSIDGGIGNDTIVAGAGNDSVYTHGGNQNVDLGDGNDTVIASLGSDTVDGGAGTDTLTADLDLTGEGSSPTFGLQYRFTDHVSFDYRADFAALQQYIPQASTGFWLEIGGYLLLKSNNVEVIQTTLVGTAVNDLLVVQGGNKYWGGAGTDTLYADWSAATAGITWVNAPTTTQTVNGVSVSGIERLLVATGSGDDYINNAANATADYISTGAGQDTLNGGAGADTLVGGNGNDTYVVDNAGDVVTESVGQGTDTVIAVVNHTLSANVEKLTLAGTATNGGGNALDNTLLGNGYNNLLAGAAGADTLDGSTGSDTMYGGLGNDTYYRDAIGDVVIENAGEGIDLVYSGVNYTLAANVENLTLIGAATNGGGNALNNSLLGNANRNLLAGAAGADTLDGGTGSDSLYGGTGDDVYYRDASGDVVVENVGEGTDLVYSSVNYTLAANVEHLVLTGTATNGGGNALNNALTGNALANLLAGAAGNDTLDGGAGIDTMIGGLGDDTYTRDNVSDVINENAGEGVDTVISALNYTLAANLENLTLTGTATNGGGNGLDNVLLGNSLANLLAGAGGNDTLDGGTGSDTMIGGSGDDTYYRDSAADVITENAGEGRDTIITTVNYTLAANLEDVTLSGAATNAGGNALNNYMTGNALANLLAGQAGDDTLDGGAGIDTMIGGLGDDLYAYRDAGDVIVENAGEGTDEVAAFVNYTLGSNLEYLSLRGTATIGSGNALDNVIVGNELANVLLGGSGADTITGGLGNDTLYGGAGNDAFYFDTELNAATNVDTVADFASGDQFLLDKSIFTAFATAQGTFYSDAGLTGSTSADQGAGIYFDTTTGGMYYDADGFGGSASVKFAVVLGSGTVTGSSFLLID